MTRCGGAGAGCTWVFACALGMAPCLLPCTDWSGFETPLSANPTCMFFAQVKHMLRVETDEARQARLAAEAAAKALRPPVVVKHAQL